MTVGKYHLVNSNIRFPGRLGGRGLLAPFPAGRGATTAPIIASSRCALIFLPYTIKCQETRLYV